MPGGRAEERRLRAQTQGSNAPRAFGSLFIFVGGVRTDSAAKLPCRDLVEGRAGLLRPKMGGFERVRMPLSYEWSTFPRLVLENVGPDRGFRPLIM